MAEEITFQVLTLGDLVEVLSKIINDIRTNDSGIYNSLEKKIDELEEIHFKRRNKDNDPLQTFLAYEKIISISLELRKFLEQYNIQLSQYNELDYALYVDNKRFYATTHDIQQALAYGGVRITKAGLMIDLKKISNELTQELSNEYKAAIFNAFSNHYDSFRNYVEGMYYKQNKTRIGEQGANINMGHVAEAHERHLQEHHRDLYLLSKSTSSQDFLSKTLNGVLKKFQAQTTTAHWHENPDMVWFHIRESLGYQRGTVAGDVYATQVKQIRDKATTLRLTSFGNLKQGIKSYSSIFNKDIPVQQVAFNIAIYLSDILDDEARTSLNRYVLPKTLKENFEFDKIFAKYAKIPINI